MMCPWQPYPWKPTLPCGGTCCEADTLAGENARLREELRSVRKFVTVTAIEDGSELVTSPTNMFYRENYALRTARDKWKARAEAAERVLCDAILAEPEWWEFMQFAYADTTDSMDEGAKALAEAVRIVREALKEETP